MMKFGVNEGHVSKICNFILSIIFILSLVICAALVIKSNNKNDNENVLRVPAEKTSVRPENAFRPSNVR